MRESPQFTLVGVVAGEGEADGSTTGVGVGASVAGVAVVVATVGAADGDRLFDEE